MKYCKMEVEETYKLYNALAFNQIIGHNMESCNGRYYSYDLYLRSDARLGIIRKDYIF